MEEGTPGGGGVLFGGAFVRCVEMDLLDPLEVSRLIGVLPNDVLPLALARLAFAQEWSTGGEPQRKEEASETKVLRP